MQRSEAFSVSGRRALYLHGFASSPRSRKATVLGAQLRDELGYQVQVPDLEEGAFPELTISRQLALIDRTLQPPAVLIGSSLGGYLASLYAARNPDKVTALILLAPAFDFHRLWCEELGPERLAEWRRSDALPVFHYGSGGTATLRYSLIEDAAQYEAFPDVHQPTLVFHGTDDPLVPVALSDSFVRRGANRQLVELSSGHELTDVLHPIWQHSKDFLTRSEA